MDSILVIDDEEGIRTAIREVLSSDKIHVDVADCESEGIRSFLQEPPLVVLLDIRLGNDSGLETFRRLKQIDPRVIVIFITGHGSTDLAIETTKLGAFDYLIKPLDFSQLKSVVEQGCKIARIMRAPASLSNPAENSVESDKIIGSSHQMQSICKSIGRLAPQDINVLILGESGTGKELIARAIYQHSRRSQATFLAINCAAIPEQLLESELFGHEQGAFTGADRRRVGKFEQCNGGTIFLDEIGDMPLATQAKMLRLLQNGEFQRVGGNTTLRTDVRLIAATNQNIEVMIEQNKFRRDLYYRLRGVTLNLPALREHKEDIAELAHYFVFRFNSQLGTRVETISEAAIERLLSYSWPGNVRELQSVIREAMIASTGPTLLEEFLPNDFTGSRNAEIVPALEKLSDYGPDKWSSLGPRIEKLIDQKSHLLYRESLYEFDRLIIQRAMTIAGGNQVRAAELLGISRPTLRSKLRAILNETVEQEVVEPTS
jgi:two-component system nitrogen regulation response regulator GlnG